ncbi:MAG: alanine racemase [Novosphingobium sp.]|nr:alanine racemase [Novosphingobium sp.]
MTETIDTLLTPALLLDEARLDRNLARMRAKIASLGVGFRPHIKTVKSAAVLDRLFEGGRGPITVSTLAEAQAAAGLGFRDILYAAALTPNKLPVARALRADGVDLKVITDSVDGARAIAAAGEAIPTLIEIDCDGARAGIPPEDRATLVAVAGTLGDGFAGVMTHCGASYGARSEAEIVAWAERERAAVVDAAETLRAAGFASRIVSLGSTPTVLFSPGMAGVTEARAGVFTFFDLVMAGIGVCAVDDIAISVLASVNGVQKARGRYLVDAGWMAMSRDRGTASQPVDQGYGLVCDREGRPYPDLILAEANQEHGVLALRPGSRAALPELAVGDLVRILPNHACATAAQHSAYRVVRPGDDRIHAHWPRFGGW